MPSSSIPFHQPLLQSYIKQYGILNLQVDSSINNPHHSILEPQLILSNNCFDGRFGIPFQNEFHITNIRVPQPSGNLTLYKLHTLIPLYPSVLSTPTIRQLVLHILPSYLIQTLLSTIPSTYSTDLITPSHHKYISHYFYLQLMPSSLMWKDEYTTDIESTILMQHLIYHQAFDKSLYHHFWHNFVIQLLKLHSVLLKIVLYFMNQFRQLLIKNVALQFLFLLGIRYLFFCMLPQPLVIWASTKVFIVLNCTSFCQRPYLKSIDALSNIHPAS